MHVRLPSLRPNRANLASSESTKKRLTAANVPEVMSFCRYRLQEVAGSSHRQNRCCGRFRGPLRVSGRGSVLPQSPLLGVFVRFAERDEPAVAARLPWRYRLCWQLPNAPGRNGVVDPAGGGGPSSTGANPRYRGSRVTRGHSMRLRTRRANVVLVHCGYRRRPRHDLLKLRACGAGRVDERTRSW